MEWELLLPNSVVSLIKTVQRKNSIFHWTLLKSIFNCFDDVSYLFFKAPAFLETNLDATPGPQ